MDPVYIISAVRTPIGSFGGIFANYPATYLGADAIKGALSRAGLEPGQIDEVFIGNVVSANLGQAPARQCAIYAGIPDSVPCTTINKVCASGMKAITIGAQSIQLGVNDLVVAGGTENMSMIPYYVPKARFGYKFGDAPLVDGLARDGLTDVYNDCAMGQCGDNTAKNLGITREAQDAFAVSSYRKAARATEEGHFRREIVPVSLKTKRGITALFAEDEEFNRVDFEKLPNLKPAFSADGTVTAANASTINDGAAALILAGERAVKELSLRPVAQIIGYADAAQDPLLFTTSPAIAVSKVLKQTGLKTLDIDFYEVNEAFAVVALAFIQAMDIDPERVNIYGGAVALGHPLGASGARIVTTLTNVLQAQNGELGLATICNGGGGASALVIRRV